MTGPCAKQVVRATVITADGRRFTGENDCARPQSVCARADLPSGVGYALCRDICGQTNHAEVKALSAAGRAARGATLYVEGHAYACDGCRAAARAAGVATIVIGPVPGESN